MPNKNLNNGLHLIKTEAQAINKDRTKNFRRGPILKQNLYQIFQVTKFLILMLKSIYRLFFTFFLI